MGFTARFEVVSSGNLFFADPGICVPVSLSVIIIVYGLYSSVNRPYMTHSARHMYICEWLLNYFVQLTIEEKMTGLCTYNIWVIYDM